MKHILIVILTLIVLSCGKKKDTPSPPTSPQAPSPIVNIQMAKKSEAVPKNMVEKSEMQFSLADLSIKENTNIIDDALTNTVGAIQLKLKKSIKSNLAPSLPNDSMIIIKTKLNAYIKANLSVDKLPLSLQQELPFLCGQAAIRFSADEELISTERPEIVRSLDATGDIYIFWRTHYPANYLESGFYDYLLAKGGDLRCGVSLEFSWHEPEQNATLSKEKVVIIFDPLPTIARKGFYLGSTDIDKAINNNLILIDNDPNLAREIKANWHTILMDTNFTLKRAVPPVRKEAITTTIAPVKSLDYCPIVLSGTSDDIKVDSKSVAFRINFTSDTAPSFEIASIFPKTANEEFRKICLEVRKRSLTTESSTFLIEMTCSQYEKIKATSCDFRARIKNISDPINSFDAPIILPEIPQKLMLDISKEATDALLPRVSNNPIRREDITIDSHFSTEQLLNIERSFDLWINVSPTTYEQFFAGRIKRVIKGDDTICSNDTLGYTGGAKVDQFFLCTQEGSPFYQQTLTSDNWSDLMLQRAMTMFHEVLHANTKVHDLENPSLPPCSEKGGTAYAAKLAVDAYLCEKDYCYGLKEFVKQEFQMELFYSYGPSDPRIRQEQCKVWSDLLGVSF